MLPGLSGIGGRAGGVRPFTEFYTTSGGVAVPAGFTLARVTIFAPAGLGYSAQLEPDYGHYTAGGGGGACSQSVLAVEPGETLALTLAAANPRGEATNSGSAGSMSTVKRGIATLVQAQGGGSATINTSYSATQGGKGGLAGNGVGDVRFSGGDGSSTGIFYGSNQPAGGGGAGGTLGSGGLGTLNAGLAGASEIFTRTSDGTTATAGNGGNSKAYGGGGSVSAAGVYSDPTSGIIIMEWGFEA